MSIITQTQININLGLRERKAASEVMSKRMLSAGFERRSERMANCMQRVEYAVCAECGRVKITQTYLCRDRFCAVCAAGLARKRWWSMMLAAEHAGYWKGSLIAMLTLTVRNCAPTDLKQTLQAMTRAFKRLQQRKFWKENIMGYARHLEITYNAETNTMHPHYHILLVLAPDANKLGVIGSTVATDWKDALRVDYAPIYDIRYAYTSRNITIKDKNGEIIADRDNLALISAFSQASKYMCKPSNILDISDEGDLSAVIAAVSGARTAAYGGCIKEARAAVNLDGCDELDDSTEIELKCCDKDMLIATAHWALGEWINDITEEVAF